MTSKNSISAGFHNQHSVDYDRAASGATINIAKLYLNNLPLPITNNSRILDNACGTGLITRHLTTLFPSLHPTIHGCDIAPNMVSLYQSRATRPNITSSVEDVYELKGLETGSFTHVITNFGIMTTIEKDPQVAVNQIYRVLEKGGLGVVTTWAERSFDRALTSTARRIRPFTTPFFLYIPPSWTTTACLASLLETAGFTYVDMSIRCVEGKIEAPTLTELVSNMMLFKDMFFKGYSEEEIAECHVVLGEELRKLDAFKEVDGRVEVATWAWVGVGFK